MRPRSSRGLHRRQELLDAAATLIAEQGFAAVSHRLVADRAGLPLAATTYYFSSLAELVGLALHQLAEQWLDRSRAILADLPAQLVGSEQLAQAAVAVLIGLPDRQAADQAELLALYDRYREAGRHPHLRPLVISYNSQVETLIRQVLTRGGLSQDPNTARLLLAQVDGAVLRALAEGTAPVSAAQAAAEALIGLLIGGEVLPSASNRSQMVSQPGAASPATRGKE